MENETVTIHSIPCSIQYNGSAQISKYFASTIEECDNSKEKIASFRGYPLVGSLKEVPNGYMAVVMEQSFFDSRFTNFKNASKFKQFYLWNYDTRNNSHYNNAVKFLELASIINEDEDSDKN